MKKFSLLESRQVILANPSLMAGEYQQMPLEYKMCPSLSQLFHECFCGVSRFKDDQTV